MPKELALINKSQGYFESIGCSDDVLGVFTVDSYQGEVAGYTNMGKSGDALLRKYGFNSLFAGI